MNPYQLPADVRHYFDGLLFHLRYACGLREAVIVGGAVRDALNGKPIKDIDVFVPPISSVEQQHLRSHHPNLRVLVGPQMAPYLFRDEVTSVTNLGEWANGTLAFPVQLIEILPWSRELAIERVDLGFSQVMYDGDVFYTDAFHEDTQAKIIRPAIEMDEKQMERAAMRIVRLAEKYDDWKIA